MHCYQVIGHNATGDRPFGSLIEPNGATSTSFVVGTSVTSIEVLVTGGFYAGCYAYVLDIDGSYDASGNSGISAGAYAISIADGNPSCPAIPATYDCLSGVCVENSGGTGIYSSLTECQSNCAWYDCTGGSCIQNTTGTGTYTSLAACQAGCAWYDCINGTCVSNTTYHTPGFYHSLALCNASCGGATCPVGQSCFDPNDLPCPTCPVCPTCPTCPDCPEEGGFCPPCPDCPPGTASCPTGQTCQLPSGEDVNFVNISAPIFMGTCDSSGNPVMGTRSVGVIQGTENAEFLKLQELAKIQGAAVCQADVASLPDGWLIRPEYHRSQVIYQFAEIDDSGNIIGAPKYKITVPHHIADQPTTPLPNYQRGNWETIYVLNDNSKVTIHSLDADNGNAMLAAIKLRINPTYMTNAYLSKSSLVDTANEIAQITVKNRMAKYYSTGTKSELPDWIKKW